MVKSISAGNAVAGVKFRRYNDTEVVLYCSNAGGFAKMVNYATGAELWSTGTSALTISFNAHSVELMPDGIVAVAGSGGNAVRFFDVNDGVSVTYDTEIYFSDAHGLLWDGQYLWVLGGNSLSAYTVGRTPGGTIFASAVTSKQAEISYGHDLAAFEGDTNKMWVTTSAGVYIFDKTELIPTSQPSNGISLVSRVKGIGNYSDGSVVLTRDDDSWTETNYTSNTKNIVVYRLIGGTYSVEKTITVENGAFYKARVVNFDYQ